MHCITDMTGVRPSAPAQAGADTITAPDPASPDTALHQRLAALRTAIERLQAAPALGKVEGDPARSGPRQGRSGPDWGLPVPLASGALNELVAAHPDRPAAFGFLFTLTALGLEARAGPALFVATRRALAEHGAPYGHGLAQLGLDVGRLLLIETGSDRDALWALEEALRSGAAATVAGAIAGGLDLTSSRRLNLAAAPRRTPLVVLSGAKAGKTAGVVAAANAAATRWRIASAPAARDRFGTLDHWRWQVALERCRNGRPGDWLIEWNHVAHRFRVVEGLADRPPLESAGLRRAG